MLKKILFCSILLFPFRLFAQEAPSGGQAVFSKPVLDILASVGLGQKGKSEKIQVQGQPFQEALRLTTFQATTNKWDVQVDAALPVPIQQGDVMLAEFWMRAAQSKVESGEVQSEFVLERLGDPWTKSVEYGISVGPQWKKFSIPFVAAESLDAVKSHISFRMGYGPQSYDLAGFKLTNYGNKVKIEDLPHTQITYEGMDAGAPWRKEAQDRIEKIRKGDLSVLVTDAQGQPVSGAKVSVRMKRQAFGFGTAVVAKDLATPDGDNLRYQQEVARLFNRVVFENDLKWGPWEEGASNSGYWRREYVEGAMRWLSDRHFDVRGHNMVWGTWRYLPVSLKQIQSDHKALEEAIEKRIQDVGGTMKGQLAEWDVVNEPVPEHDLTDILGKSAMVTWYQIARKVDPKPVLFVNDYPGPDTAGHLDGYEATVKFLLDNGAPLGGIGLQGHVGETPWSIPALLKMLDRFGTFGLPVEITEFDDDVKDPDLEGQFFKDFLTAVYSHPSTNGFLMWGFWDGAHWHHKAPVFNADWTEKPSGKAYEQLVLHDWWTNAAGVTDEKGAYQVRGFLGDYEITAVSGSKTVTIPAKLGKEGLALKVVLK